MFGAPFVGLGGAQCGPVTARPRAQPRPVAVLGPPGAFGRYRRFAGAACCEFAGMSAPLPARIKAKRIETAQQIGHI